MFIFSSLLFFEFFLEKAGSGKISKESLFPLLSTFCLMCDRNNSWSQYLNAIQLKMFNFNFSIWIFYPLKITNTFFNNVSFLLMHDWFDQTRIVIKLLYVPHIFVNWTNRQNPFGHSITSNFKISQVILAYSNVNESFSTFKLLSAELLWWYLIKKTKSISYMLLSSSTKMSLQIYLFSESISAQVLT